ncbi:MAG: amino acid adenylation domain-containing protein [Acidobacteriota bacterium]
MMLTNGLNRSTVRYPDDTTAHALFEAQAARTPDSTAVVCGDERFTYRELDERANRVAHAIRAMYAKLAGRPFSADTLVGLCMSRRADLITGMLAILKAGGAFVPLDPAYPERRLKYMMDDAGAPIVVSEHGCLEQLLFLNRGEYGVISIDGGWPAIQRHSAKIPAPLSSARSLAYLMYTSGSTGRPKGALIEHRGMVNCVLNEARVRGFGPQSRCLQSSSIAFDAAVLEIWPALLSGSELHLVQEDVRRDSIELIRYMSDRGITHAFFTPALLRALPRADLPSLRSLVVAGDVCDADTMGYWSRGRALYNAYGPTETTVAATMCQYGEGKLATEIGGPIANVALYVLDQYRNPTPVGVPGELYIGGDGVTRGYHNWPELTAERFLENPFATDEDRAQRRNLRMYRTGDRVRWLSNGSLEFLGRVDCQVKIRGFRIEPGEIEAALAAHPEVRSCAVMPYGDGADRRLAAYFVPVAGAAVTADSITAHLRLTLPEYMIPSAFVELEALPLSPSGKVDRNALPAPRQAAAGGI